MFKYNLNIQIIIYDFVSIHNSHIKFAYLKYESGTICFHVNLLGLHEWAQSTLILLILNNKSNSI